MAIFEGREQWDAPETEAELRATCERLLLDVHDGYAAGLCTAWEVRLAERFNHAVMAYLDSQHVMDSLAHDLTQRS